MNVIFTCGGTAGHISPALAVASLVRERYPDTNILFVGAEDGMETDLVPPGRISGWKPCRSPISSES